MSRVRLGDVAKEHKETCKGDKSDYPVVGLEHLEPECITLSQWSESADNTFSKVFRKGHVLFGRRRAYLRKAVVAPFDGICSGDITVIEAIPRRIIPELLPFVIQNETLFDFAVRRSAGSLSPRVKWEHLKNYEFELPESEEEQRKLADVLWSIEQTRASYRSLLRATDELVKSQFIELFGDPKKNTNAVGLETAFTIRDDLRKPINDAVRSEMHTGELYPYYGANGQVDRINEYLMDCDAICLAEDCGAYGAGEATSYIVSGKCWVNNHAHVLIPKDCCDIEFANVYFRILDMTEFAVNNLEKIGIEVPVLNRQKKFSEFAHQLDKSKFELEQALSELSLTYKRILAENLG